MFAEWRQMKIFWPNRYVNASYEWQILEQFMGRGVLPHNYLFRWTMKVEVDNEEPANKTTLNKPKTPKNSCKPADLRQIVQFTCAALYNFMFEVAYAENGCSETPSNLGIIFPMWNSILLSGHKIAFDKWWWSILGLSCHHWYIILHFSLLLFTHDELWWFISVYIVISLITRFLLWLVDTHRLRKKKIWVLISSKLTDKHYIKTSPLDWLNIW